MSRKTGVNLLSAALVLFAVACNELPGTAALEGPPRSMEPMPYTDAVPADWGPLILVTTDAEATAATMWFQDDSGSIRLVGFHLANRQLLDSVTVINRR